MRDVPILDDAYMRRRAQMRYIEEMLRGYTHLVTYGAAGDTPESLRDDYATGKIDYDELHRRLDAVLRDD